jgi:hypothetical protein
MITIRDLDPAGGEGRFLVEVPIDAYGDLDVTFVAQELLDLGQKLVAGGVHVDLADAVWRFGAHLLGLLGLRLLASASPTERHTYVAALGAVPTRQLEEVRDVIRSRAEGAAIAELEEGQSALDRKALVDLFLGVAVVLGAELDRRLEAAGTLSNPSDVQ